jgi:DNA polymerase-1
MGKKKANYLKKHDKRKYKVVRNAIKNGHFALGYGAGLPKISATIQMSMSRLRPGYELYKRRHPNIVDLINIISSKVKQDGYIRTPFGRKLYRPVDEAYTGLNYLIQGTAAGILKRAQVRVDKYLK